MARARLLKPEFFEDERLAELPFTARILFESLWCQADREGLLEDRPQRLAAFAFPYDNDRQIEARREAPAMLDALVESGIIVRYEADGMKLLCIPSWDKHQKIHPNEPKSSLPPPLVTNDHQKISLATNVAGSGSRKEAEAEAEADTEAEAKAETRAPSPVRVIGFNPLSEPFFPEEPGFVAEYVRHVEKLTGNHPGASKVSDAAQLERDFGFDACMLAFRDTNWEKPPTWVRPKLEQRAKVASAPLIAAEPSRKSLRYQAASP